MKTAIIAAAAAAAIFQRGVRAQEAPPTPAPNEQPTDLRHASPAPPAQVAQAPQDPAQVTPRSAARPPASGSTRSRTAGCGSRYGSEYTYEPDGDDAYPYQYVYRPYYGWDWLAASVGSGPGPGAVLGRSGARGTSAGYHGRGFVHPYAASTAATASTAGHFVGRPGVPRRPPRCRSLQRRACGRRTLQRRARSGGRDAGGGGHAGGGGQYAGGGGHR